MHANTVVPKLWVGTHQWIATQFLADRETGKLRADMENVLSPMETERSSMCMHVYSWVDDCTSIHFADGEHNTTRMVPFWMQA